MKRPTLFVLGTVLLVGIGVALFVLASYQPAKRSAELENFHLVGPTGRSYSIESFPHGSVLAIYFGYATCLRSCPTALNSLAEAIDRLGKLSASVQPVFIDMDPERAALTNLPVYMESFGPSFLGLTGSPDDIERASKSFKVKLERIQLSADPTDYVMKHASPIFVMRPNDPHPRPLPATSSPELIETALRSALSETHAACNAFPPAIRAARSHALPAAAGHPQPGWPAGAGRPAIATSPLVRSRSRAEQTLRI